MGKSVAGRIKTNLIAAANWVARPLGLYVIPAWQWRNLSSGTAPAFQLGGIDYQFFIHNYNCGWNPATSTERVIELALADRWLSETASSQIIEVGAVTPYYWPGRVGEIADPADPHPAVTVRQPIDRLDLKGKAVLSLSTFEHIGTNDYGLSPNSLLLRNAVDQICREAEVFLITVPTCYSPVADAVFLAPPPPGVTAYYLVRDPIPPYWLETDPTAARREYGPGASNVAGSTGANGLVVWERGSILSKPQNLPIA